MSTATATDLTAPLLGGRYHFLLRRLHSLTGIIFGGYLVVHLIVNATIADPRSYELVMGGAIVSARGYQINVNKIHELPFLVALEWGLIYLPILYHTIYGIWITLTGQPNVVSYPYGMNWLYLLQRISAAIIFFFLLFHVLSLKYGLFGPRLAFDPHNALGTVARHIQRSDLVTWVVYPLGVLASCFHLANGFYTAGITWGLTVSAGAQRRWGIICAVFFVVMLAAGMTAVIAAANIDPQAAMLGAGRPRP